LFNSKIGLLAVVWQSLSLDQVVKKGKLDPSTRSTECSHRIAAHLKCTPSNRSRPDPKRCS